MRFGWTPEQVGRMDPDFVEELLARCDADDAIRREAEEAARKR